MTAKIWILSVSFGKIGVIEDSQGQLHREQVSYAMHRACCVAEDEEKGFALLLRGRRKGSSYQENSD